MLRFDHAGQLRLGQREFLPVIRLFNLNIPVALPQPPQIVTNGYGVSVDGTQYSIGIALGYQGSSSPLP